MLTDTTYVVCSVKTVNDSLSKIEVQKNLRGAYARMNIYAKTYIDKIVQFPRAAVPKLYKNIASIGFGIRKTRPRLSQMT